MINKKLSTIVSFLGIVIVIFLIRGGGVYAQALDSRITFNFSQASCNKIDEVLDFVVTRDGVNLQVNSGVVPINFPDESACEPFYEYSVTAPAVSATYTINGRIRGSDGQIYSISQGNRLWQPSSLPEDETVQWQNGVGIEIVPEDSSDPDITLSTLDGSEPTVIDVTKIPISLTSQSADNCLVDIYLYKVGTTEENDYDGSFIRIFEGDVNDFTNGEFDISVSDFYIGTFSVLDIKVVADLTCQGTLIESEELFLEITSQNNVGNDAEVAVYSTSENIEIEFCIDSVDNSTFQCINLPQCDEINACSHSPTNSDFQFTNLFPGEYTIKLSANDVIQEGSFELDSGDKLFIPIRYDIDSNTFIAPDNISLDSVPTTDDRSTGAAKFELIIKDNNEYEVDVKMNGVSKRLTNDNLETTFGPFPNNEYEYTVEGFYGASLDSAGTYESSVTLQANTVTVPIVASGGRLQVGNLTGALPSNQGVGVCNGSLECANCIGRNIDGNPFRTFQEAAQAQIDGTIQYTNSVYVAIGCVDPSQEGITVRLIQIALGISGFVILIRFGQAALLLQKGDPESYSEGGSIAWSALLALIMILFAAVGMQFLGINIFRVLPPGTIEVSE
ncbi:hypothetical protein KC717_05830 [Candidatus Dojkabacteria bacterium]|uniref:Uncharacterized protein n=1 Tax=Candidatus Dojkabacteria bacterium TaxID=2099670 RepID=A0A955RKT8_9BACT|nr:hypothetical protein [Candidatus Dojkabacteria bacterium]